MEKAARVYAINELMPVMEAMKHINDWLGEEVSSDPRYFNSNLVSHPYTTWNK